MTDEVLVLVYHSAADAAAIEDAYREASREMSAVPGLLGNELLRGIDDPDGFVVVSRWRDLDAFREWERGARHQESTAPLRPYRDYRHGAPFAVYRVTAAY